MTIPKQLASSLFDDAAKAVAADVLFQLQQYKQELLKQFEELEPSNSPEENRWQAHTILSGHLRELKIVRNFGTIKEKNSVQSTEINPAISS